MDITIRKGTVADVEEFIALLETVREAMDHKEWFYLDPPELVRQQMHDGTMEMWAATADGRMVGVFDVLYPGLEEYNYGYHLDFNREQLLRVVHMDTAAVHPDWRGLGIQRRLLETAEQELKGAGARYLLCTIHPENVYSLNNALKQGYEVQKTLEKYGSVRHILCKKIF